MKRGSDSPARSALQSIARGAGRSRLGDRLPEDKRPSPEFMISIGLGPKEEDEDPDAETHGYAFDDDPVLPGRVRKDRDEDGE